MPRVRISTTVDSELLEGARRSRGLATDAELIDEALGALLQRERSAQIDAQYGIAYTEHPMAEPDEWGDLESFRQAASQ